MKRLSTIVMMLVMVALSMQAQKTYVLLAGVSNYGVDSINLANTTDDVKKMKKIFIKQGITPATLTSRNANHDNIVNKLNAMIRLAKPEDRIFFFFSGHGTPGGFVPSDRSLFNYQELVNILSKARAGNIYCFIDACMSGSVKSISSNNFGVGNKTPNICFMTASDATEISRESPALVGHGFFTKALLKGLSGMSDKNEDKKVTLGELYDYVKKDVLYRTRNSEYVQHPLLLCPESMKAQVIRKW